MADTGKTNTVTIDRVLIYRWLSKWFAEELDFETLTFYHSEDGKSFLNQLATEPALAPLVTAIRDLAADKKTLKSNLLDLKVAYARLFLGAGGHRSAPPYHSAYASEKGLMFQSQMTEMVDLLRELDLSVVENMKEPPDHIAIQLGVLAELIERTEPETRQLDFIDKHLAGWLPAFRDDCVRYDLSRFYGLVASTTFNFLEMDRTRLSSTIGKKS